MKTFLREPLLHFLLLGVAIFAAYQWLRGEGVSTREEIVVTQGRVQAIAAGFARTWQRPPSQSELEGLVRDYVREEVASREAVAMGLERDDVVIRRRLRQKIEFIAEDTLAEPTEADLRKYLDAHPGTFRAERNLSFEQVFLDPKRHTAAEARALAERLREGGVKADEIGDATLLDRRFFDVASGEVERQFGSGFAEELAALPLGVWTGPVESGYGLHLVRVGHRTEPGVPSLAQVREQVHREWRAAQREANQDRFYRSLLAKYSLRIDMPQDAVASNP